MKNLNQLLIGFLWASSAHKFSQAKMASEAQKPLAKMEFLIVHGYLATISLEPWNFTNLVKKLEKTTELCEIS